MNQKERLLKALELKPVDRPPAAVPTQNATVDVMNKSGFTWPVALRKAKEMAGLAWACHEIGGIESVRIPFDITIEAEAMGCETRFSADPSTPPVSTPRTRDDYGSIRIPDPSRDGRMPEVLEAIKLLKEKTRGEVPLIAAFGAPYELLSTTLDYEDIALSVHEDPDFLVVQLKKMTEIAKSYGKEIEKAGADVLMLVDGTSQNLGPRYFGMFSQPFTTSVVESLTKPTILHICGDSTPLLEQMVSTGVSALSVDKPVDVSLALEITRGKVALVGKISPHMLCVGSKTEILEETEESLKQGMHVISPGCGILPQTPLENLRTYIDCVVNWHPR